MLITLWHIKIFLEVLFFKLIHAGASFLCTHNSVLPSPQCLQKHNSNFIESPLTFAKVKNIFKIFELELIYLSVMLTFIHPCQLNRHSKLILFQSSTSLLFSNASIFVSFQERTILVHSKTKLLHNYKETEYP